LPSAQVRELPNGLKVAVIERRSLPLLTLRLVVKAGAEADPPSLAGTAQLTADLLSEGTSQHSARQIAETVDAMGGNLETRAGWDDSSVELTVLSDRTVLAFSLLADVVRRPTFPAEEIERKRQQTLSALEVLRDDPAFTADSLFQRLVFSGTPYGHTLDGTEESVRRIARPDLAAFHARHYQPANCILAAVGDITVEQAVAYAATYFGDWEGTPTPAPRASPLPEPPSQRTIVVVDKPDAVQTEIRVGNLAIPRDSGDYLALTVANQVLGGPAANRLFRTLRSRLGIAYGASSDLVCQQTAGNWVAKTSTRTEETVRSLRSVIGEMEDLRDHRISAAELHTAQSYLTGHMALEFETSADVAEQTLELMVHNLPLDYWSRFQDNLSQLDADEVYAASRRYLDPEHCVIVLVGEARRFTGQLRKFGPYRVIRSQDLDLAAPDLVRPAATPNH
jgi:zinc protease